MASLEILTPTSVKASNCIVSSEKKSRPANLPPSVTVLVGFLVRTKSVPATKARTATCNKVGASEPFLPDNQSWLYHKTCYTCPSPCRRFKLFAVFHAALSWGMWSMISNTCEPRYAISMIYLIQPCWLQCFSQSSRVHTSCTHLFIGNAGFLVQDSDLQPLWLKIRILQDCKACIAERSSCGLHAHTPPPPPHFRLLSRPSSSKAIVKHDGFSRV